MLKYLKIWPWVAILRGITPQEIRPIAQVLIEQGVQCIEVPMNSPQALESMAILAQQVPSSVLVGAGTVTYVEQVEAVARAGGRLVVMPHTDEAIIHAAKAQQMYCVPGFATATEAFSAIRAGADALKFFPAQVRTLRALKAILPPTMPVLAVGGVSPATMADFLAAGASGFGLGSGIYQPGDRPSDVLRKVQAFQKASK